MGTPSWTDGRFGNNTDIETAVETAKDDGPCIGHQVHGADLAFFVIKVDAGLCEAVVVDQKTDLSIVGEAKDGECVEDGQDGQVSGRGGALFGAKGQERPVEAEVLLMLHDVSCLRGRVEGSVSVHEHDVL